MRARRIGIHGLPNKIGMVKNAPDHDNAMHDISVCAHASIEMHGLPNKIGRVKNAPDYDSARCDIRVTAHAVLKCTGYRIKSVGLRMGD